MVRQRSGGAPSDALTLLCPRPAGAPVQHLLSTTTLLQSPRKPPWPSDPATASPHSWSGEAPWGQYPSFARSAYPALTAQSRAIAAQRCYVHPLRRWARTIESCAPMPESDLPGNVSAIGIASAQSRSTGCHRTIVGWLCRPRRSVLPVQTGWDSTSAPRVARVRNALLASCSS